MEREKGEYHLFKVSYYFIRHFPLFVVFKSQQKQTQFFAQKVDLGLSGRIWSRKAGQLCTSQIEASTSPPGATSRAFELSKIGLFKFPPLGAKTPFKCPPISNDIPLLKDKFRLQSNTAHTFQREICCDDTFKLLLKTVLKELFTNKGEILSCKFLKPCKNRKNSREYYARTSDKSGSNSPPFQGNVPPFLGTTHSQMPGVCPGGNVEASI